MACCDALEIALDAVALVVELGELAARRGAREPFAQAEIDFGKFGDRADGVDRARALHPSLELDRQQEERREIHGLAVVALVPAQKSERQEQGRQSGLLLRQPGVGGNPRQARIELVGDIQGLQAGKRARAIDGRGHELIGGLDAVLACVLDNVERMAVGPRRQAEPPAHMVAQPAVEIGERSIVLPRHRIERPDPGEIFEVHRPGLPQRGEEAGGALVVREVVGLRQRLDGKFALLAGKFRQYRFEVAIDDAELAARTDPMPVVEHRILARKIEQLGTKLVEKPLTALGFVVCVRHAVLRTIPVKYFFHNRAEPSRPHRPRRGGNRRAGGYRKPAHARAAARTHATNLRSPLLARWTVMTEIYIHLHPDRERAALGQIDQHLHHADIAQPALVAGIDAPGIDERSNGGDLSREFASTKRGSPHQRRLPHLDLAEVALIEFGAHAQRGDVADQQQRLDGGRAPPIRRAWH